MNPSKRVAIITGASSGLGREFARQLDARQVADELWLVARNEKALTDVAGELDTPSRAVAADLTSEADIANIRATLSAEDPRVTFLVNAAGFGKFGDWQTISDAAVDSMIDLNCRGLTEMTCTCLPWMHKGTRIINLASAAAFCPQAKFAVYAATKSYVLSFSRSLAAELKEKGIFVTAVCPGPVDTPFFEVSGKLPGGMKEAVMADPVQVVKQALIDAKYKKEVSVYGTAMKGAEAATKVLPHGMILKAMSMIEKITKE